LAEVLRASTVSDASAVVVSMIAVSLCAWLLIRPEPFAKSVFESQRQFWSFVPFVHFDDRTLRRTVLTVRLISVGGIVLGFLALIDGLRG
jgi:TctA family transporter